MIIIGIGANLPHAHFGPPRATCGAALQMLEKKDVSIVDRSSWYETAPVPVSDQPWYVNGVAAVTTSLPPEGLIARLLAVEATLGRTRGAPNAARVVDLDLLAYGDQVRGEGDPRARLQLPHPRMHERSFVLNPLCDMAENWVHPVLNRTAAELRDGLRPRQAIRRVADAAGLYGTEWNA